MKKSIEQTAVPPLRQSWEVWFWWVLATTLGVVVGAGIGMIMGIFAGVAVFFVLDNYESPLILPAAMVVGGAGFGSVLGAAQSKVLRRYIPMIEAWVQATTIGGAIGGIIGGAVIQTAAISARGASSEVVYWAMLGVVGGAAIGGAQLLVLRRYLRTAGWWLLANILAFVAGGAAGGVISSIVDIGVVGTVLGLVGLGAVSAALSGIVLVRLVPLASHTDAHAG